MQDTSKGRDSDFDLDFDSDEFGSPRTRDRPRRLTWPRRYLAAVGTSSPVTAAPSLARMHGQAPSPLGELDGEDVADVIGLQHRYAVTPFVTYSNRHRSIHDDTTYIHQPQATIGSQWEIPARPRSGQTTDGDKRRQHSRQNRCCSVSCPQRAEIGSSCLDPPAPTSHCPLDGGCQWRSRSTFDHAIERRTERGREAAARAVLLAARVAEHDARAKLAVRATRSARRAKSRCSRALPETSGNCRFAFVKYYPHCASGRALRSASCRLVPAWEPSPQGNSVPCFAADRN